MNAQVNSALNNLDKARRYLRIAAAELPNEEIFFEKQIIKHHEELTSITSKLERKHGGFGERDYDGLR